MLRVSDAQQRKAPVSSPTSDGNCTTVGFDWMSVSRGDAEWDLSRKKRGAFNTREYGSLAQPELKLILAVRSTFTLCVLDPAQRAELELVS